MQDSASPFLRLKLFILILSGAGLSLFSLVLCQKANPLHENITGIGWVNGQFWLMVSYCLYGCLFCAYLSYKLFSACARPKTGWILAGSWLVILAGSLVPWQDGGTGLAGLDIHSLLCSAAVIFQALLMIWMINDWQYGTNIKKTAGLVLASLAVALVMFAWSQSVSLLCEISYVNCYAWIFCIQLVRISSNGSSGCR